MALLPPKGRDFSMRWIAVLKGVAVFAAAIFATASGPGCGSGVRNSEGSTTTTERIVYPAGPTRQFFIPGGDNAVQTFGHEATAVERKQATATISAWMRARATRNWAKDCSYFSAVYLHQLIKAAKWSTEGRVKSCSEAIVYLESQISRNNLNNFGSGPVVSLRIEDGHGFAQYHGNDGKDWVVPVEGKSGRWKVAFASP